MFNVIDAQSTVTAVGRFQAYPVLMSLQHGVIEKKSDIAYCTASVIWKIQFTTITRGIISNVARPTFALFHLVCHVALHCLVMSFFTGVDCYCCRWYVVRIQCDRLGTTINNVMVVDVAMSWYPH